VADEIPYQQAAQVRQLLAERETAQGYGLTTRVEAADKQLAELGWVDPAKAEAEAKAAARRQPPKGRTSAASKKVTAEGAAEAEPAEGGTGDAEAAG